MFARIGAIVLIGRRCILSATRTPDGRIHRIRSALHYQFNLAGLKTPASALRPLPG